MTVIDGDRLIIRENLPEKVTIKEPGPPGPNALSLLADVDFTTTPPSVGNVLAYLATGKWGPADVATDAEVATAVQVETDRATTAENAITTALDAHENATLNVHGITDTSKLVYTNDPRLVLPGDLVTTDTTQTITGGKTFQAANATAVGLIIQGAASQTGDLLQLKNSAGTVLTRVDPSGSIYTPNGGAIAAGGASAIGRLTAYATSATDIPVVVKGFAAQSVDLQQWRNAAGTVLSRAASDGGMYSGYFQNQAIGTYMLYNSGSPASLLIPAQPSHTVLVVKGAAAQSANLQEWQDSSGAAQSRVTSAGYVYTPLGLVGGSASLGAQMNITALAPGNIGAIVRAAAAQTADIAQFQNSAGTATAGVSSNGDLYVNSSNRFITPDIVDSAAGSAKRISLHQANVRVMVMGSTPTDLAFVVQGAASQSVDLMQWQKSDGTVLNYVTSGGNIVLNDPGVAGAITLSGVGTTKIKSVATAASHIPLVAQGAASQTADLTQWQSNTGRMMARVDGSGVGIFRYFATRNIADDGITAIGSVGTSQGSTPNSGFINWYNSSVTRLGYMGFSATDVPLTLENGATFQVLQSVASAKGLIVKGAAAQTANLQEWQDSTGTVLAAVSSGGIVETNAYFGAVAAGKARLTPNGDTGGFAITTQADTNKGLIIRSNSATQSVNLFEAQNVGGTALVSINGSGLITGQNRLAIGAGASPINSSMATFLIGGATNVGIVVQGAASQTGDLQQWLNSASSPLARIDSLGNLVATSITAGASAHALMQPEQSGGSLLFDRATAQLATPAANSGKLYFRAGSVSGVKLVALGPNGVETTIADNL